MRDLLRVTLAILTECAHFVASGDHVEIQARCHCHGGELRAPVRFLVGLLVGLLRGSLAAPRLSTFLAFVFFVVGAVEDVVLLRLAFRGFRDGRRLPRSLQQAPAPFLLLLQIRLKLLVEPPQNNLSNAISPTGAGQITIGAFLAAKEKNNRGQRLCYEF